MTEFTAYAFAMNMVYLLITLAVVRYVLAWFDHSLGVNFKEHAWDVIQTNPLALGLYHGLRFVGVCLLASAFLR